MGSGDLRRKLGETEHFLPLPKEPAALANIIEVSVVDFLVERAGRLQGVDVQRGTERGYPDLEFSGTKLTGFTAVDIKVAKRRIPKRGTPTRTQSRITLSTGNTFFLFPTLKWPGTFRPFAVAVLVDPAQQDAIAAHLPWVAAMTMIDGRATAYVCRNFACDKPFTDPGTF